MSSKKFGFTVAITPCRFLMRAMGVYPDPIVELNWLDLIRFLATSAIILTICNVSQSAMVVKVWGDLNEVIEVLTTMNLPTGCAFFKFLGLRNQVNYMRLLVTAHNTNNISKIFYSYFSKKLLEASQASGDSVDSKAMTHTNTL